MIPTITWRQTGFNRTVLTQRNITENHCVWSELCCWYLEAVALAHPQTAHPHVSQQHLAAGVGDEVSVFGSNSQLQTGGVTPVLQLVGQQLHGHLLVMFVRLIQQLIGQLTKLPAQEKTAPPSGCDLQ